MKETRSTIKVHDVLLGRLCEVPSAAGGRTMNIKARLFTYSKQVVFRDVGSAVRQDMNGDICK